MNANRSSRAQPASPSPAAPAPEGETLVAHFVAVMETLVGLVRQENELVRAGRIAEAMQFGDAKAELTRRYIADAMQLRTSGSELSRLAPERLDALRKQHQAFRSLLQVSQTVLATAHAVSEGIVRGVSSEMARKAVPQTYGASGRPNLPGRNCAPALAVSRSL